MGRITFTTDLAAAKVAAGEKTQTRRLVTRGSSRTSIGLDRLDLDAAWVDRGFPHEPDGAYLRQYLKAPVLAGDDIEGTSHRVCPRHEPGDVLDVCESFAVVDVSGFGADDATLVLGPVRERSPDWEVVLRREEQALPNDELRFLGRVRWRSGRFMPTWAVAQRIRVTAVRPERLLDISEADARAEGFENRAGFIAALDRINKGREPGDSPWVWVINFEREV
ncbi:MAG: hypothetical protein H6697_09815 [Myxococcales bacterium]|nr:hypothetical protein [Myxococcales bacterium]